MKSFHTFLILIVALFCFNCSDDLQTIKITTDNTIISAKGSLGPAVKNKNNFYFILGSNYRYLNTYHFYSLSSDGKTFKEISLPDKMFNGFYDIFLRNDSVVAKSQYNGQSEFCFDSNNLKWKEIQQSDDKVYEDANFYVTFLDFGEWGGTIWFRDKKTGIEYETASSRPIINKINNCYYITTDYHVREIENPFALKRCKPGDYYKLVKTKDLIDGFKGSDSEVGTILLYESAYTMDKKNIRISTSFVSNEQLYHICVSDQKTFLAKISEGKMKVIKVLGNDMEVYKDSPISGNEKQFLKFYTSNSSKFGFIEVSSKEISIHYLKNLAVDISLGSMRAEKFLNTILENCHDNFDDLLLSQIDSMESNWGATDLTQRDLINQVKITDKSIIETPRIYKKTVDSRHTILSYYYYSKSDKKVKVICINWDDGDHDGVDSFKKKNKTKNAHLYFKRMEIIEREISLLFGKPMYKEKDNVRSIIRWKTDNGLRIELVGFNEISDISVNIYKDKLPLTPAKPQ